MESGRILHDGRSGASRSLAPAPYAYHMIANDRHPEGAPAADASRGSAKSLL